MISSIECFQLKTTQSINRLARSETNGEPNGNGMMQKGKGMKSAEGKKNKIPFRPESCAAVAYRLAPRRSLIGWWMFPFDTASESQRWILIGRFGHRDWFAVLKVARKKNERLRFWISGFDTTSESQSCILIGRVFFFEQVGAAPTTSRLKSGATAASASCWAFCSACWPCSPRELPWGHDPPTYPSDDPPLLGSRPTTDDSRSIFFLVSPFPFVAYCFSWKRFTRWRTKPNYRLKDGFFFIIADSVLFSLGFFFDGQGGGGAARSSDSLKWIDFEWIPLRCRFGVICAFVSNRNVQDGIDELPAALRNAAYDTSVYFNGTRRVNPPRKTH